MTKKLILTLTGALLVLGSQAQKMSYSDSLKYSMNSTAEAPEEGYKEGWNSSSNLNIGFAQSHLENWAAGGEVNALTVNGLLTGYKTRKAGRSLWENTYYASYGLMYLASNDFVPQKTDDRLDLASKYGWQLANRPKWYIAMLGRFQTQFSKGYNYSDTSWKNNPWTAPPISELFSPAYITLAVGAEYKPNKNFNWFISPAAARFTFVKSRYTLTDEAFGVAKGKTNRVEFGAYSTMNWVKEVATNITYRTRLDFYMDYFDPKGFGMVDMLWDNTIAMKVNDYIGMTFGFTLVYDNDVPGQKNKVNETTGVKEYGPLGWFQLKQVFNVGFAYSM